MNQTAQGLAALGRGPDTELVHMTKGEIAGLQSLAQQHGKSLTINPDTGLPEAGILSSILPIAAGFALGPAGFGVMSSAMAGLAVGGVSALASGSLQKGLMAGLGAYGGAGLGESLMGAATSAPAMGAALPTTAAVPEAIIAAPTATGAISATGAAPTATAGFGGVGTDASMMGYPVAASPIAAAPVAAAPVATATQMPVSTASGFGGAGTDLSVTAPPPPQTQWEKLASGARNVTASPQAALGFAKANMMPLGAAGISALSGMEQPALNAPEQSKGMIRPYTFTREKNPNFAKDGLYFTDKYTAGTPYAAPGPEYMAGGGTVEAMSNANALGASTNFPQANIRTGAYSTPFQQPVSQNIVTGAQDAAVDPYTGQMNFAGGGTIDLHGTINTGGQDGQGGFGGGYSQMGGGFGRGDSVQQGGTPQQPGGLGGFGGLGGMAAGFGGQNGQAAGGFDQNAISANPRGFMDWMQQARTQEQQRPGSTMFGQQGGMMLGGSGNGMATGGLTALAAGGMSNLGGYSDGGQLLRGPGDGVSDDIPAMIGQKQQARLADGEFVVPARIVSELGNGSTEAGARQLYAMMDRVQKARGKSIGKGRVATDSKAHRHLPA